MRRVLPVLVLLLIPLACANAQGVISENGAEFARIDPAWGALGSASLTGVSAPATTNHLTSLGWAYRVLGDTRESFLPPPDTALYGISVSEHHWSDVDARGLFSATETATVLGPTTDAPSGSVHMQLQITNLSGTQPLTFDLFHAIDPEIGGGSQNSAALLTDITFPNMKLTAPGGDVGHYLGNDADGYTARPFGPTSVRSMLSDNDIDNFDDGGLPAGPADLTAGVQWGNRTLQPGESRTYDIVFAVNRPALSTDLLVTLSDAPDPVAEGSSLDYMAAVSNAGAQPAPGVVLDFGALPDGVDVVGTDGCNNDPGGFPQCEIGLLDLGQTRLVSLRVVPTKTSPPQLAMSVAVSSPDAGDPVPENNIATVTTTVVLLPRPDMRLTKTNDVAGVAADVDGWNWQLDLHNAPGATADAMFGTGDVLLVDQLPSVDVVYGAPVFGFPGDPQGPDVTGTAACTLVAFDLTCVATSPMTFAPGTGVKVTVPVLPQATGPYANPRAGGLCSADPGGAIDEKDEGNNTCSDAVLAVDFLLFGDGFEH